MSGVLVRVLDTLAGRFVVEATARGIVGIDRVGADVVVGDGPGGRAYDDDNARGDSDPGLTDGYVSGEAEAGGHLGAAEAGGHPGEADAGGHPGAAEAGGHPGAAEAGGHPGAAAAHLDLLVEHLDGYLAGTRHSVDVPLDLDAAGVHDEFAREVYREIQHIPYGETSSYGQVSIDAGRPRNARRVGRLCSLVPVPFIIPVHRVIRADGGLGSCPEYRLQLLEHERRNLHAGRPVAFPRG